MPSKASGINEFFLVSFFIIMIIHACAVPICPNGNCYPYCEQQPQSQECEEDQRSHVNKNPSRQQPNINLSRISSPLPHMSTTRGGSLSTPDQMLPPSANTDNNYNAVVSDNDNDDGEEEIIDYDSIALALRLTCELNRQLMYGTNGLTCAGGHMEQVDHIQFPDASQSWFHIIKAPTYTSASNDSPTPSLEPLTIFHAKSPRTITSSKRGRRIRIKTGCARWGPSLALYLQQLHTTLKCPPLTFALALVYLDRACSAETQRGPSPSSVYSKSLACPHLNPRTVHRLVLTAMVIASKAMDAKENPTQNEGEIAKKYSDVHRTFGITEIAMSNMESWMLAALGEQGTWVDMEHMKCLWNVWQYAFMNYADENPGNPDDSNGTEQPKSIGGIGLRKELKQYESLKQHYHTDNSPQLQNIQEQYQQQWIRPDQGVLHVRREQRVVHIHHSSNSYHNDRQYQESMNYEYSMPQMQKQNHHPDTMYKNQIKERDEPHIHSNNHHHHQQNYNSHSSLPSEEINNLNNAYGTYLSV